MAFCASCGSALAAGARFCPSCGASVGAQSSAPSDSGATPTPAADASSARETRRTVTVLFADVVGSTAQAETLDPEVVRGLMQAWFAGARAAIEHHGGTVEKFIGDAVMAVFGVPTVHEDDALRAARAASELSRHADARLQIRVGLETGEVVAGEASAGGTLVTGDAVNTAARLQAAADPGDVLIGEGTWRLVRAVATTEPLEPLILKGKREPVQAHRLVSVDLEATAIARRLDGPMVGRASELQKLREAVELVGAERICRVCTVVGQAGIGKSRLVHEFLAEARQSAAVIRGRCLPYGDGITYWPLVELLHEAIGIDPAADPDEARQRIGSLVAGVEHGALIAARLCGLAGIGDDVGAPQEVAWAFRRLLEHLARDRPLVVVVDDIQWAEPALIDLLEHVQEWAKTSPILLLCMARSELFEAHPAWMRDRDASATIRLGPLSEEDGARLVDELLGGLSLAPTSRARIAVAADGNPLFIEQLLAMLLDDGVLAQDGGRWVAQGDLDMVAIPPSISALLAARLDRLPGPERATIERASVVGKVFWWGSVIELTPERERSLVGGNLATLVRREFVRADHSSFAGDEAFRFRHLLVRDAAYAGLPKSERALLHERFYGWLERRVGENSGEYDLILGYHLEQAYRFRVELGDEGAEARSIADRALRYLAPAGRAASERGDARAASSLLKRSVDLCPPGRERIALLFDLASALWQAGEADASDAADAEAVEMLTEFPDEGLGYRQRLRAAWMATEEGGAGTFDEVIGAAREAYAFYQRHGDSLGMMRALSAAGSAHAFRGEVTMESTLLDEAMMLAREIGLVNRAAMYSSILANRLSFGPIPVPDALERCRRYLAIAGENREARATILLSVGFLEAMDFQDEDWRHPFDEAKAIVDDLGLVLPTGAADHPMVLAMAELEAGDPSGVEELLRWSCKTLERLKDYSHLATVAPLLAEALMTIGRLEEVEGLAFRARDVAAHDDLDAQVRWRFVLARLRSAQGRHDEARQLAQEAVDLVAPTEFLVLHADALMAQAIVLRSAGDEAGAAAAAEEARRLAARKQNRAALRRIEAFLAG